jgi:hypothetical protein
MDVSTPNQAAEPAANTMAPINSPEHGTHFAHHIILKSGFVAYQLPGLFQNLIADLAAVLELDQHQGPGEELIVLDEVAVLGQLDIHGRHSRVPLANSDANVVVMASAEWDSIVRQVVQRCVAWK